MNDSYLRPQSKPPAYPPYHRGEYLEEYFYRFYTNNKNEFDKTGYSLIPIFWTNVYHKGGAARNCIQPYLDSLPEGKYFTVCQHVDAVAEKLPEGTMSFAAGGNKGGIPLPLICSPIPRLNININKDIFCSFVGSNTHPIRDKIFHLYNQDDDFLISCKQWVPTVPKNELDFFINTTSRSKFSLAPRGYGPTSFRMYEILQLNSIPVIVYDRKWLPFEDEIDYDSFCVLVNENEIDNLKNILNQISDDRQYKMLQKGKEIYEKYFTLEGMCEQVKRILNERQNHKNPRHNH